MVPEIPNPSLPDIAAVGLFNGVLPTNGMYYNGYVIHYNPRYCQMAGPSLSMFTRTHEYGHIELNHLKRRDFLRNPIARNWISRKYELEADSFATENLLRHGHIQAVRDTINYFYGQGPIQMIPSHPPGTKRAINIINTAKSLGFI